MAKHGITDPVTQFGCDGCGRVYNKTLQEGLAGAEYCPECFAKLGGVPTLPEERVRKSKERAVVKAQAELKEAVDAEAKAKSEKKPVSVRARAQGANARAVSARPTSVSGIARSTSPASRPKPSTYTSQRFPGKDNRMLPPPTHASGWPMDNPPTSNWPAR
jgi:hypothetical protein